MPFLRKTWYLYRTHDYTLLADKQTKGNDMNNDSPKEK